MKLAAFDRVHENVLPHPRLDGQFDTLAKTFLQRNSKKLYCFYSTKEMNN
jgi:hypothetical protein